MLRSNVARIEFSASTLDQTISSSRSWNDRMTGNEQTDTWDMEVSFEPLSYTDGKHWILIKAWSGPDLPNMYGGKFGLDLYEGTTEDEARELQHLLLKRVERMTYTGPVRSEFRDTLGRSARLKESKVIPFPITPSKNDPK